MRAHAGSREENRENESEDHVGSVRSRRMRGKSSNFLRAHERAREWSVSVSHT
jgi:hypothetical protein